MYKTYSTSLAIPPPDTLAEHILAKAKQQNNFRTSIDLFPFFSILVSANWNKNADIFTKVELLKARHTPENKPINWMHIQDQIIGHSVHSLVVDSSLNPIPDDAREEDVPEKIHIVMASVIYSIWEDKDKQKKIDDIIRKVNAGELYVSMEALFKNFSYGLINAKGEEKFIRRNSQTNYLTKFLRQYKGPGRVGNYTIGRLLEDITFSAAALVDKPANVDSIISDNLDLFKRSFANLGYITLDEFNGELVMPDTVKANTGEIYASVEEHPTYKDLMDKHNRLQKDHAEMSNKHDSMRQQLDHIHECTMAKENEEKDKMAKEKASLEEALAKVEKEKKDAEAALASKEEFWKKKEEKDEKEKAALASENEALKKTKKEYEDASKAEARATALMDVDKSLTKVKALEFLAKAGDITDTAFDVMVSMMTAHAAKKETTAAEVIDRAKAEQGADTKLGSTTVSQNEVVRAQVLEWSGVKARKGEK